MNADIGFEYMFEINTESIRQRWQRYFEKLGSENRSSEHIAVYIYQRHSSKSLHTEDGKQVSPGRFNDIFPQAGLEPNTYIGIGGVHVYVFNTQTGEIRQIDSMPPASWRYEKEDLDPSKIRNRNSWGWRELFIQDRHAQMQYRGFDRALGDALSWRYNW